VKITSSAFGEGQRIPDQYTRDGSDRSPPLVVEDVPDGAHTLAVIVDDPDAPSKTWVHWLIWGIPADRREIPEALPREGVVESLGGARQGRNDFGDTGYGGPLPPRGHGTHRYRFTAYALGREVHVEPGAERDALESAIEDCTLDSCRLTGWYERS
jgi:Raf kinase inhibitor-like YbhB/YbcL family protein